MRPLLGICAIVRNEERYIYEWLSYHRYIGVQRFTIYDNQSTDRTVAEIARFGHPVDLIHWPGEAIQIPAYRDMLLNRQHYAEWCAFIDVDEFLLTDGTISLPEMLRFYGNDPSVVSLYAHWLFFGGRVTGTGGVTQRFQHRAHFSFPPNRLGKSIVKMGRGAKLFNPHLIGLPGGSVAPPWNVIDFAGNGGQPVASHQLALAHYFCKTPEEWTARRALGRPALPRDHPDSIRKMDQYHSHDCNDVHDTRVAEWLQKSMTGMAA